MKRVLVLSLFLIAAAIPNRSMAQERATYDGEHLSYQKIFHSLEEIQSFAKKSNWDIVYQMPGSDDSDAPAESPDKNGYLVFEPYRYSEIRSYVLTVWTDAQPKERMGTVMPLSYRL